MQLMDILMIVFFVVVLIGIGLYFLNRWAIKRSVEQQSVIEKAKMQVSIYVIDKKHDKAENVNLPKVIMEDLPKIYKVMKLYMVKAKIGPQIMTLMCDKRVFNMLIPKKTYKVELAGIYIVSVKGMKTKQELKLAAKAKAAQEKEAKKQEKLAAKAK